MPGKIPAPFIDALLARIDIVELIDGFVPLRKMGKDFKACCPFHEEKTPSFTVSQDKQFYHCFGCGAHGTAIGFLLEYEHMRFREAVEELAKRAGMTLPTEAQAPTSAQPDTTAQLLEILQQTNRYFQRQLREHAQAPQAVDYLKRRGLSGEIAAQFGIGFAPEAWDGLLLAVGINASAQEALFQAGLLIKKDMGGFYDRFRGRVMFPIHDYRGRIVGFGGRILAQGEPKYLNSPETPLFHKGRELYGLYHARDAIKQAQRVLVVEGYMDVVALAQFGIGYAVATLGTATTRDHLERLYRYTPEIVFCFDGDRAGREAAWRALENALPVMHEGRQASFLFLPDGEDPDTLVRKEGVEGLTARLQAVEPLPDFLFRTLEQRVDMNRVDGRARLIQLAKPLLDSLKPGALRELMINRLAERARMKRAQLDKLLRDASPGGAPRTLPEKPGSRYGRSRSDDETGSSSLMRKAIALIVQDPMIIQAQRGISLPAADLPGMELLNGLWELLSETPNLNTAAILERFHDSEHQPILAKLAIWDYPQMVPDRTVEFADLVGKLQRQATQDAIDNLSNKTAAGSLTEQEKAELRRLLKEKTRPLPKS